MSKKLGRRSFLKAFGLVTAGLPLAGMQPKDEALPDIIEVDAVTEDNDEPVPDLTPATPYAMPEGWRKWELAEGGGFLVKYTGKSFPGEE